MYERSAHSNVDGWSWVFAQTMYNVQQQGGFAHNVFVARAFYERLLPNLMYPFPGDPGSLTPAGWARSAPFAPEEPRTQGQIIDAILGPDWPALPADCMTSTVVALARAIRADRDSSALPILADALQDAGLDETHPCLDRLRSGPPYYDGDWTVRSILKS